MSKEIVDYISECFNHRKSNGFKFSLRAFAAILDIEPSILSKILSRKRKLTFDTADKILTNLNTEKRLKQTLLLSLATETDSSDKLTNDRYRDLTEEELNQTSEWYFYAIASALEVECIEKKPEDIAEYLALPIELVQETLNLLEKLKMVLVENGQFRHTGEYFSASKSDKTSKAFIDTQLSLMDKSKQVLISRPSDCSFSGITVSVPDYKYDLANKKIMDFKRELALWLSEDDDKSDTTILRLNFHLLKLNEPS